MVKFAEGTLVKDKKRAANFLMSRNKNIKTVVEKVDKVKGRLRTLNVKWLDGEKNFIADYKENNCRFRFDIKNCYFSPRLSEERKIVASMVKKNDSVLVMFSGAGFFPIVIAKNSKCKSVVGVEIGKICCDYAQENVLINKVGDRVKIVQGDVKRVIPKLVSVEINTPTKFACAKTLPFPSHHPTPNFSNLNTPNVNQRYSKLKQKFSLIVMPRPQLKDTFLKDALKVSKKGTRIIYYGFARVGEEKDKMIDELKKIGGKKVKIVKIVKAGDLAPYKFRWRIEILVK